MGEAWAQDAGLDFGEEAAGSLALLAGLITSCAGDFLDQAVPAQGGVGEALWGGHEEAERLEQRHGSGVAELEGRGALVVDPSWLVEGFEGLLADRAVLAELFELQQAAVGGKADSSESGQVFNLSADREGITLETWFFYLIKHKLRTPQFLPWERLLHEYDAFSGKDSEYRT